MFVKYLKPILIILCAGCSLFYALHLSDDINEYLSLNFIKLCVDNSQFVGALKNLIIVTYWKNLFARCIQDFLQAFEGMSGLNGKLF